LSRKRSLLPVLTSAVALLLAAPATAAETELSSAPSGVTADSMPEFRFSSPDGEAFTCRLAAAGADAPAFEPCSSPFSAGPLADGSYTFEVAAVDAAGIADDSPAAGSFRVDTTPPQTTITSGPASSTGADAVLAFDVSERATFTCRLDGGAWEPCESPRSYSGLALGPHLFEVQAVDEAGNAEPSPASHLWQVLRPGLRIPAAGTQALVLAGEVVEVRGALRNSSLRRIARRAAITLNAIDAATAGTVVLQVDALIPRGKARAARRVRFMTAQREVPAPGAYPLKARLTQRGRRLARRQSRLAVELKLGFTDVAGRSLWASAKTTLAR
jgi:hypothetical protein